VTFTNTAVLDQALTTSESQVMATLNAILPSGPSSYIGSGIAEARRELLGPRHNPSATPVMIVLSDGADAAAPGSGATLAAATAAKAAGIEIISVQYGSTPSALMQSIATASANYYLVAP
jgi:Mg-chelatase subunit ChlD